ncbi:hypothetical protein MRX96_029547 [Rhipicephalus microplus]
MPGKLYAPKLCGPSCKCESSPVLDPANSGGSGLPSNMLPRTFQNSSSSSTRSGKKVIVGSVPPTEIRHPFSDICARKVRSRHSTSVLQPLCSQGEIPKILRTTPRDVPGNVGVIIGQQRATTRSSRIAKGALPRGVSRGIHCLEHARILRGGHHLYGQVVWSAIKGESQVQYGKGRVRGRDSLSDNGARFRPSWGNANHQIGYTLVCCSSVAITKNGRLLGAHERLSPTFAFVSRDCLFMGTMVDGAFPFSD